MMLNGSPSYHLYTVLSQLLDDAERGEIINVLWEALFLHMSIPMMCKAKICTSELESTSRPIDCLFRFVNFGQLPMVQNMNHDFHLASTEFVCVQ